jgi:hypothetical protein
MGWRDEQRPDMEELCDQGRAFALQWKLLEGLQQKNAVM